MHPAKKTLRSACTLISVVGVLVPVLSYWWWAHEDLGLLRSFSTLWTRYPSCPVLLLLPFVLHSLWVYRLARYKQYSVYGVSFLTFSGLCGSTIVLWPGLQAVWGLEQAPSIWIWAFLAGLASVTMAIAVGAAYLTITYLWIYK